MAKLGRKPILRDERDAKKVQTLAGYGLTLIEIAHVVGMSQPTLGRLYMHELETGHIIANAAVAQSLFKQATHPTRPNVAAGIFWAKTRMRWRESDDEGKRAAAELLARVAEKGTGWDGLLAQGGTDEARRERDDDDLEESSAPGKRKR